MKLAIVGSRTFSDYDLLVETLKSHYLTESGWRFTEIVSGAACGADSLAAEFARINGIKLTEFLPDWDKFGKSAGFKRNVQIVDYADEVLAFQVDNSKGTGHSIELAKRQGKPVKVIQIARGRVSKANNEI